MYQFEKLLKQNNINENDPELERVIVKKIKEFRKLQSSITAETTAEERDAIEAKMDDIDDDIMKTLPEFFDIEDEVEENKKKQIAESAKKAEEKQLAKEAADKEKAEQDAKKEAELAELNKPATNDDDALDKLFRKGQLKVTENDLKKAGFKTGFFGNLEPFGAETKRYKLKRSDISQPYYDLTKK
jgi:hypothetical protein